MLKMKRRRFIKYGLGGVTGMALSAGLYSWQVEPFWLEMVEKKMPIKNLPLSLQGKKLMQISDIHVGNRFPQKFIIESFLSASKLDPDIVVYTGDFVTYENAEQLSQLKEVMKNPVKGKLGTLAILGNHDYGHHWNQMNVSDDIQSILSSTGIKVLRNEKTEIEGLHIIGIDDYWGINFFPEIAMNHYDPSQPSLVLCHNPDVCDLPIWKNYKGWILSGHTHGGQVKPPFLKPPLLPVKNPAYSQGEIDLEDGRKLYINRALGHLHQVRFNVRPEITIFTLEMA